MYYAVYIYIYIYIYAPYSHMNELSGRILSHALRELDIVVYRRLDTLLFGMLTCLTNQTFTGNVGNPTINQWLGMVDYCVYTIYHPILHQQLAPFWQ